MLSEKHQEAKTFPMVDVNTGLNMLSRRSPGSKSAQHAVYRCLTQILCYILSCVCNEISKVLILNKTNLLVIFLIMNVSLFCQFAPQKWVKVQNWLLSLSALLKTSEIKHVLQEGSLF